MLRVRNPRRTSEFYAVGLAASGTFALWVLFKHRCTVATAGICLDSNQARFVMKWIRRTLGFALLARLVLVFLICLLWSSPCCAQAIDAPTPSRSDSPDSSSANAFSPAVPFSTFHYSAALSEPRSALFARDAANFRLTTGANFSPDYGFIDRMEAAFIFLDTPFAEQVRLPVASLWHGRLKFDVITTNITTADFVWGLPGAGSFHILSMGSGFIALHAPKSDQASGIHVTLHPRGSETQPLDDSLIHGIAHALRAGRDLIQR
jgi:hypothetical protein